MEENAKSSTEMQRRLNPNMKEVVKNEVIRLLDNGIIYPISDSKWVSPTHVVPKKSGVTVITNGSMSITKDLPVYYTECNCDEWFYEYHEGSTILLY